ncbi:MAG: calcium-translocating P-type ATPase, PMCA-type [Tannerellaceae bacterium]|nr:calcium-translocating P-type ATPase, PMCA-type [Tannerellaceae bacterium]
MQTEQYKNGLSDAEVVESRKKNGSNILTPPEKKSTWLLFLEKFEDPIIRILLIALLLSVAVSIYQFWVGIEGVSVFFEPGGIFIAVILATGVGFLFELNANKKFEILNQVNDDIQVKVIRNGNICQISKREVVVGDIVLLETGEEVPADGILLESVSLQINESTLTGEPVVSKTIIEADFKENATYPPNEVLKGTTVVDGHGVFRVTKVGDATEYGKVYEGSQIENDTRTPLNNQLDGLGKLITKVSYGIAGLIVVVRLLLFFIHHQDVDRLYAGTYILNTLMIAITLVVVSVPEGLPMSIVLSLALSMKQMLSTNNLVRKMHACETMGAVSVICTDKTGTLTKNQMQVYKTNFWNLESQQLGLSELSNLIKEGIAANSTAFLDVTDASKIKVLGNPTEGALLLWLQENQVDYLALRQETEVIQQLTFSTERKYMATLVQSPLLNKKVLYVKGAPEIVLGYSQTVLTEKGLVPAEQQAGAIREQLLAYQEQAMRTLGFAYQIIDEDKDIFVDGKLNTPDLIFIGITAISDPVREDVPDAIRQCMDAGIQVKIVTGDTPGTAKEIGRQIGLWQPEDTERNLISGVEFAALSDEELSAKIRDLKIIARARPMDKERLVKLLQKQGQIVAVTGDGTNDAPALNAAHVGLSMGDGTMVAKEASDITILDNSFSSIARAVMWGRSLYQNIQRFILFQLTINVVACLIVLIGAFLGTESPLTVTQMLWVNLIMDTFAALAFATLPPNEEVMKDKPRKQNDFIIAKEMAVSIVGRGLLFVVILFGILQYFKYEAVGSLSEFSFSEFFTHIFRFSRVENSLSSYELAIFFTVFVMFQFWNMFNAKAFATKTSALHNLKGSKPFLFVALVIFVGQVLIVTIGGQMFNVEPLLLKDWIYIIVGTSFVLWLGEFYRFVTKRTDIQL